jgi:hypothetical protein
MEWLEVMQDSMEAWKDLSVLELKSKSQQKGY